MDQGIRNKLRSVVTQCRKLLEEAVRQVLQGQFGIYESGKKDEVNVEDESRMKNLSEKDKGYRRDIQAHLGHIQALGYKAKDALAQLVREIAFTHLNRLCAYKMMEARAVWIGGKPFRESVSRGMKSQGFQFYLADHPEDKQRFDTGRQDMAYRHFLGWLGARLSEEIGVLFSPTDPANRLIPPQRVLDDVLALLNSDDLKDIWAKDETIGWVYQYFTPKELRDQVRKESAAPRNSYELAFRNQFFTPRYVVEFLTDNTLGRIWYEMRKGDTKLKEQCRYMVRRPSEVFLTEGQTPPEPTQNQEELSQEELLKQTVYIPHRPKKDPRELRILDPACGSGHFLLYCFDLLLTIYEEAYPDPDLGPKLKADYPTLEALRRDVPRLILAHNLHGIDIDLRATQIAALALWLRCQRSYREMDLKQDRPKITKSNIVCAEPMPGEKEMLDEFLKGLKQDRLEALIRRVMIVPEGTRVRATESMVESLNELVRLVWDKMQMAGEAGSLLKIEEELQEAVRLGQEEWEEKQPLFRFTEFNLTEKPKESYLRFVPGEGVSFWQRAEALVLEALREYARHAANDGRLQRQLFVDDAAQGFAFIDLCQKRVDVVLMNPPFGSPTINPRLSSSLPVESAGNLYAAFVLRSAKLLRDRGMTGCITDRTFLLLSTYQEYRDFLRVIGLRGMIDLGWDVLDGAQVATCAYVIAPLSPIEKGSTWFIDARESSDKRSRVFSACSSQSLDAVIDSHIFETIPTHPIAHWAPPSIRDAFALHMSFEPRFGIVRKGLSPGDSVRFVKLWWEIPQSDFGFGRRWAPYANGGSFSPYYRATKEVVDWRNNGEAIRTYCFPDGRPRFVIRSADLYGTPGLTFGKRGEVLNVQLLPSGQTFSNEGYLILPLGPQRLIWRFLAFFNSVPVRYLVNMVCGLHKEVGAIKVVPVPSDIVSNAGEQLEYHARKVFSCSSELRSEETTPDFRPRSFSNLSQFSSINKIVESLSSRKCSMEAQVAIEEDLVNKVVARAFGLSDLNLEALRLELKAPIETSNSELAEGDLEADTLDATCYAKQLLSWVFGCVFGRWNLRYTTGESELPALADPFDPFAVCSPGMLQGSEGLPLTEAPLKYPIGIACGGIIADDPDHPDDIVRRVQQILELIWKDRAEAIEREACEILGVKELRDYFRKPGKGGFWDDHVSRYSKSRRKAPIYWLLQSSKKNYGLWLYYHRLDKDILFKARQNYVDPKIRLEQNRLDSLRSQKTSLGSDAKGVKKIDKDIERQEALLGELKDFADKLERAAKLNFGKEEKLNSDVKYDPDLNDGVVLNIAPLWELVPWKEAKNYWEELLEGKYEWSSMGKLLRKKGLAK